jgi:D-3-phosphoglycerate dehydrogenase
VGAAEASVVTMPILNITLIAAPEGNRSAVAEHALGMLSLFNKLNRSRSLKFSPDIGSSNQEVVSWVQGKVGWDYWLWQHGTAFAKSFQGF